MKKMSKKVKKKKIAKPKVKKQKSSASKGVSITPDLEWEFRSAADTLARAEEIKMNKKLYRGAMCEIKKRKKALSKI